jgi:hypothetical protein
MRCPETTFQFGSTYVEPHGILEPYVTRII